jgi:hypothetical protein
MVIVLNAIMVVVTSSDARRLAQSSTRTSNDKQCALVVGWLVVGCWLLVVGCWLLVVGCWLLVVGCWLLVVGWLLIVGC